MSKLDFKIMRQVYFQSTPFILVVTLAEIGAGSLLVSLEEHLLLIPGLLFMLPGLMELRGNIAGALASRLGSAIHIGLVSWEKGYNRIIRENVNAAVSISAVISLVLSVGVFLLSLLLGLGTSSLIVLAAIGVSTAVLSSLLHALLAVFVTVYSAHRGVDPDNVSIPVVAMLGDLITVMFLLAIVNAVLSFAGPP